MDKSQFFETEKSMFHWWSNIRWFMVIILFAIGIIRVQQSPQSFPIIIFIATFLGICVLNLLFHLQIIKTNNIFATVNGIVIQDSTFDFAGVFGMTEQEFKDECISRGSYIETPANNEPMPDSLTWTNNDLKIQNDWSGSGILVINGDLMAQAHIDFDGILVVFGEVNFGAHSDITGAVYVIGDASLGAHAVVTFDADVVKDAFDAFPIDVTIEIVEWNDG